MNNRKLVWCAQFSDGTEVKFRSSQANARKDAQACAEKKNLVLKNVYPVLYPRNPYKRIFKKTI